jgi:hypothetical protein
METKGSLIEDHVSAMFQISSFPFSKKMSTLILCFKHGLGHQLVWVGSILLCSLGKSIKYGLLVEFCYASLGKSIDVANKWI